MNEKLYLLTYKGSQEGESGEGLGTPYSLENACRTCGTGATLMGSIFVNKIKFKKLFTRTLNSDFLIANDLYYNLKLANCKIGDLTPVINKKSAHELPYFYFTTSFSFPKMLTESQGVITEDQCVSCHKDGYFDDFHVGTINPLVPRRYVYRYEDIKKLLLQSDVFHTWEHFGKSNLIPSKYKVIGFARPRLIVKDNVKLIFDQMKIKSLLFEEIILV